MNTNRKRVLIVLILVMFLTAVVFLVSCDKNNKDAKKSDSDTKIENITGSDSESNTGSTNQESNEEQNKKTLQQIVNETLIDNGDLVFLRY